MSHRSSPVSHRPTSADARHAPKLYFSLVDQLRGVAALSVIWAHLVGEYLDTRMAAWWPLDIVSRFVERPLGIIQHFGWFGVALFFFISGFVISHAASRESGAEFLIKRVFRIFPPLAFSIALIFTLHTTGVTPIAVEGTWPWFTALTLVNYLIVPQVIVSGVAWTLVIEVFFYLAMWALGRMCIIHPAIAPAAILVATSVVCQLGRSFGDSFFLVAICVSYLPLLVMGQFVYLARMRRIGLTLSVVGLVSAFVTFGFGLQRLQPGFLEPGASYGANAALAFLLFTAAVALEGRIPSFRPLRIVAARSYSLYLIHGVVGLAVLALLWERSILPYWLALPIALAAVTAVTEVSYRFVERPAIALGRRLSVRVRA